MSRAVLYEFDSQLKSIKDWCGIFSLSKSTVYKKIRLGITLEEILGSIKLTEESKGKALLISAFAYERRKKIKALHSLLLKECPYFLYPKYSDTIMKAA